jgi:DNA topoisomerase-1
LSSIKELSVHDVFIDCWSDVKKILGLAGPIIRCPTLTNLRKLKRGNAQYSKGESAAQRERSSKGPTVCICMGKYTLIITEKPDTARRIASALDQDKNEKRTNEKGVPYYLARRDTDIVVVPALGHLYTVSAEKKGRSSYPVFNYKWVPRFTAERKARHVRKWLEVIMKLSKNADRFVDACDYDMEGSVIGYCILKYACGGREKVSKRMKFSTLVEEELEKAYVESLPHLDFALIEAGKTRHEVDWLYGINLSRALTFAAKKWSGKYRTLSTGRVQGPLLRFLVSREKTIRNFVPTPYWQIKAKLKMNGQIFTAEFAKQAIETWKEAYTLSTECKGGGQIE